MSCSSGIRSILPGCFSSSRRRGNNDSFSTTMEVVNNPVLPARSNPMIKSQFGARRSLNEGVQLHSEALSNLDGESRAGSNGRLSSKVILSGGAGDSNPSLITADLGFSSGLKYDMPASPSTNLASEQRGILADKGDMTGSSTGDPPPPLNDAHRAGNPEHLWLSYPLESVPRTPRSSPIAQLEALALPSAPTTCSPSPGNVSSTGVSTPFRPLLPPSRDPASPYDITGANTPAKPPLAQTASPRGAITTATTTPMKGDAVRIGFENPPMWGHAKRELSVVSEAMNEEGGNVERAPHCPHCPSRHTSPDHPAETSPHHPAETSPHHPAKTSPHHPAKTSPHHPAETSPDHPADNKREGTQNPSPSSTVPSQRQLHHHHDHHHHHHPSPRQPPLMSRVLDAARRRDAAPSGPRPSLFTGGGMSGGGGMGGGGVLEIPGLQVDDDEEEEDSAAPLSRREAGSRVGSSSRSVEGTPRSARWSARGAPSPNKGTSRANLFLDMRIVQATPSPSKEALEVAGRQSLPFNLHPQEEASLIAAIPIVARVPSVIRPSTPKVITPVKTHSCVRGTPPAEALSPPSWLTSGTSSVEMTPTTPLNLARGGLQGHSPSHGGLKPAKEMGEPSPGSSGGNPLTAGAGSSDGAGGLASETQGGGIRMTPLWLFPGGMAVSSAPNGSFRVAPSVGGGTPVGRPISVRGRRTPNRTPRASMGEANKLKTPTLDLSLASGEGGGGGEGSMGDGEGGHSSEGAGAVQAARREGDGAGGEELWGMTDIGSRVDVQASGEGEEEWVEKEGRLYRSLPSTAGEFEVLEMFDSDDLWSDGAYVLHGLSPPRIFVWIGLEYVGCNCQDIEERVHFTSSVADAFMKKKEVQVPQEDVMAVVEGGEPDDFWDYFVLG